MSDKLNEAESKVEVLQKKLDEIQDDQEDK